MGADFYLIISPPRTYFFDMSRFSLTVGIPTYNRPEALLRRLNELDNFAEHIDRVIICDNSALLNDETKHRCAENPNWHYEKNPFNLGWGPNLLKAIGLTEDTTHFWVRGDDDQITISQINAVLEANLQEDEFLILDSNAQNAFVGQGLEQFCENFRKIQSMGWLSMLVIPTKLAKQALATAYWGVSTGYPHFSLVIGMFLKNPNLKFHVVPFEFSLSEFRDVGEKSGQRWAFFNLCIKAFSRTAETIPDPRLRRIYLREWRKSQTFRNVKKLVAMKIGLIRAEPISFSTLSPLLSLDNANRIPLFVVLYLGSKVPRSLFQYVVAIWAGRQSQADLIKLNLAMIQPSQKFAERLNCLQQIPQEEIVSTVY